MKIASYNVMSGGFDDYGSKSNKPERLENIKKAVKKINADFIALVDTYKWEKIYTKKELQKMFDYKKGYSINLNDSRLKKLGHNNGITVLTNFENVKFEIARLFDRNSIKSCISIKGKRLVIYSVYLDDVSERTRMKQIEALMKNSGKEKDVVVMGDFNAIDQRDLSVVSLSLKKFIEGNKNLSKKFISVLDEMKKTEVMNYLKKNNFSNASSKFMPTVMTKLFPAKVNKPFMQLDYVFYNSGIKVKRTKVLYDKVFDEASDHYPIVVEI